MNKTFVVLLIALLGCTRVRVPDQLEPQLDYALQDRYLLQLPSPFAPLSPQEKQEGWSQEYTIALGFAHELDLYQSITAFKRARYLLPTTEKQRLLELDYEILLCYYIGKKYADVVHTFTQSPLAFVDTSFPPYQDLLLILFDSYTQLQEKEKAAQILRYLQLYYPVEGEKLQLFQALQQADMPTIRSFASHADYLSPFLTSYEAHKKSISRAQIYNALLPGAGYFYLGQKQSALTAFLLNGLFISASALFFLDGNVPAGVIFTFFEAGWYFGGIYGVGQEAKFYNERLYEAYATPMMNQNKLFPALSLRYAF